MGSIMYSHPRVYEFFMRTMHGSGLSERYRLIASEVGRSKNVFEVGCGTGLPAGFLHDSCVYQGIDLNDSFVDYAKAKGLDVRHGNMFDESNYNGSDVILVCDVLHHITPNHGKLIDLCKSKSGKVIICEPYKKKGFVEDFMSKLRSNKLVHSIFGDGDGINAFEDMVEWNSLEYEDVHSMMREFGAKKIVNVGSHLVGVIEVGASSGKAHTS